MTKAKEEECEGKKREGKRHNISQRTTTTQHIRLKSEHSRVELSADYSSVQKQCQQGVSFTVLGCKHGKGGDSEEREVKTGGMHHIQL